MVEKMNYNTIQDYLTTLIPERLPEVLSMEAYAIEKRFPIIGPVAGYACYHLARMLQAKRVFELGSGFGYSTYWFARAVRENGGGEVHHTVWDADLSKKAQHNMDKLGYRDLIRFHIGEAVSSLENTPGEFDLIFNDINKEDYPSSLTVIENKLRPGGLLIVDNMLWSGRIFDDSDDSESTRGVKELSRLLTSAGNWITTLIPVRDGLMVAYKK